MKKQLINHIELMIQNYREKLIFLPEDVETLMNYADFTTYEVSKLINKFHFIYSEIADNGGMPVLKSVLSMLKEQGSKKTTVCLNKDVTIMKDLSKGCCAIWAVKYKDLDKALLNENEIEVKYCFGQRKRRINLLSKLGYSFKETIFYNDEELHSPIKEVWSRSL